MITYCQRKAHWLLPGLFQDRLPVRLELYSWVTPDDRAGLAAKLPHHSNPTIGVGPHGSPNALGNLACYFGAPRCHAQKPDLRLAILRCCRQSFSPGTTLRLQRLPDFVTASHCCRDSVSSVALAKVDFAAGALVAAETDTKPETALVTTDSARHESAADNIMTTNKIARLISSSNSQLQRR